MKVSLASMGLSPARSMRRFRDIGVAEVGAQRERTAPPCVAALIVASPSGFLSMARLCVTKFA